MFNDMIRLRLFSITVQVLLLTRCHKTFLFLLRPLEGKSCYDLAAGKEDILTLLEVHLLTTDSHVNGNQRDEDEIKDEGRLTALAILLYFIRSLQSILLRTMPINYVIILRRPFPREQNSIMCTLRAFLE